MEIQFKVNHAGEGVFSDSLGNKEYNDLTALLKLEQIHYYNHMPRDENHKAEYKILIDSVFEVAEKVHFTQPDFIYANFVLAEYYRIHDQEIDALKICTKGILKCLEAVPDDFKGKLASGNLNVEFHDLVKQYLDRVLPISNRFKRLISDENLDPVGLIDFMEFTDQDEKEQKRAMLEGFKQTLRKMYKQHADIFGTLARLVPERSQTLFQNQAVFLATLGDIEAAKSILQKEGCSTFYKSFNLSAIACLDKNYTEALFYFRFGIMLNPQFARVLKDEEEPGQYFYPDKDGDYFKAREYLESIMGGLWWGELYRFGIWASESWPVLQDRAIYKKFKYEQARGVTNLDEYMLSYELSWENKKEECAEATAPLVTSDFKDVLPWELETEDEY